MNIQMASLNILALEQKKQFPQGIIKAPTTWDPIGNLKIWEEKLCSFCIQHNIRKKRIVSQLIKPLDISTVSEWPMFNNLTSNLMPCNTGAGKRNLSFDHVQIGVANSTGCIIRTQHNWKHNQFWKMQRASPKEYSIYNSMDKYKVKFHKHIENV